MELDVEDLEDTKNYSVTLKKPTGINELSVKNITVEVVLDNSVKKEFKNVSVVVKNLDNKYTAMALDENENTVTVIVEGSEDIINSINSSSIKAYVDLKNYTIGQHEVPVEVEGSDLKLIYKSKTKTVKIEISEKKG